MAIHSAGFGDLCLDKENGMALYRQLAEILRTQIADGVISPGRKLPSEAELSAAYRVNRHTVRQAISVLASEGLVYKLKGSGTFVAQPAAEIDYRVSRWTRFTENILELGRRPGAQVRRHVELPAPVRVAQHLGIASGEKVAFLEILRFVDEEPFCLTQSYFPVALTPGLTAKIQRYTSLYELLEREYGLKPMRTRSVFSVEFPSLEGAVALGIPRNLPVLQVESTMVLATGQPVEYSIGRFRADRCKLRVDFT